MMVDWSNVGRDYPVTSMQFTKHTHLETYPAVDPSAPANNLTGKVVIVTGASRGIGAEGVVPAFLEAGVKGIALLATNAEKLAETERSIKTANPDVETVTCALDISNIKGVGSAFAAIKAKFGHADFLVHAAGAAFNDGPKLHETDQEEWWRNFEVNGKGAYLLVHAFLRQLPDMRAPATIVLVSSWQAFYTTPQMSGYMMSKFIVDNLATYVAAEYPNVTAVAVHPGLVPTDLLREPFRTLFDLTSTELVGGTTVWLCHEKARFLSGRWMSVNWDVEELVSRKDDILKDDLLKLGLRGSFGHLC